MPVQKASSPSPMGKKSKDGSIVRSSEKKTTPIETTLSDLPLLDEVNELLEKEKMLMGLKILEQKKEKEEWKAKYDQLLSRVSETGDLVNLEGAAKDVMDGPHEADDGSYQPVERTTQSTSLKKKTTYERVNDLIMSLDPKEWILDLSGKDLGNSSLSLLLKGPTSLANANFGLQVFNFSRCGLTDESAAMVGSIMSKQNVMAIDLSHNSLGKGFESEMLSALKIRRRTPQYILLAGNMPMASSTCKAFSQIISTLTDSTWGLSVSLQDFADLIYDPLELNAKGEGGKEIASSSSSRRNATKIGDLIEPTDHPMYCADFLKALVTHLDPMEQAKEAANTAKKPTKVTKDSKAAAVAKAASKTGTRNEGLKVMAVFGLSYAQISKKSIGYLEKVLELSASTLVDLDLSFSYSGVHGAEMLKTFLERPECQLVHLNVAGNSFGDNGSILISQALKTNQTLTALDLRSNNMTNAGIGAVASCIVNNRVLYAIDCRGNSITYEGYDTAQRLLKDHGSQVSLKFIFHPPSSSSSSSSTTIAESSTSHDVARIVYENPFRVCVSVNMEAEACLYSIDMRHINTHFQYHQGSLIVLDWSWRPIADALSFSAVRPNHGEERLRGLGWEVRVTTGKGEYVAASGTLSDESCQMTQFQGPNWARCRAVLSDLPVRGFVEVWAILKPSSSSSSGNKSVASGGGGNAPTDNKKSTTNTKKTIANKIYSSVESALMKVSCLARSDNPSIGGDLVEWSDTYNNITSVRGIHMANIVPRGHQIIRALRYLGSSVDTRVPDRLFDSQMLANVRLTWRMKLGLVVGKGVNGDGVDTDITDDSMNPAQMKSASSIGYEWTIWLFNGDGYGGCEKVASGECFHVAQADDATREQDGISENGANSTSSSSSSSSSSSTPQLLKPWVWTSVSADVKRIRRNTMIVISAALVSTSLVQSNLIRSCSVQVTNCRLHYVGVSEEEGEEGGGRMNHASLASSNSKLANMAHIPSVMSSAGFVLHNDCQLIQMPR